MTLSDRLKEKLQKHWEKNLFFSPVWKALATETTDHSIYASYLLETYHYTKQSPLIQCSALPHFQENYRNLARPFLAHALEEESHFRLCVNDLVNLGYSREKAETSRPLPLTEGYLGYIFSRIQFHNALSYLGYLFQLEYMASTLGPKVASNLLKSGLSKNMLTFLSVHAHEDIEHVTELEALLDETPAYEHENIIQTALTSNSLFIEMMNAATQRRVKCH